ncbi:MAG: hypothetical protein PWP51_2782, partial [Clostridiales bacterium]|nr:hypothetical protein [Clostridiales bacterium]
ITLDATSAADAYWGMPYIEKAIEMNLLENYTTAAADYEMAITREEMASIIVKAYDAIGGDTAITDGVVTKAQKQIGDLVNVSASYKTEVTTAYALNFIAGYGDGSFKPLGSATRGEASVVISKLLDDSMRTPIEEDKPLEVDMSWQEWLKQQPDSYIEQYISPEYLASTYENGVFTIVDCGFGWGDLEVTDDYIPDFTARLNNLLDYAVRQKCYTSLYNANHFDDGRGVDDGRPIEFNDIFVNFESVANAQVPYFQYRFTQDAYMNTDTYVMSKSKVGATIKLRINDLYDEYTVIDDAFWETRYDERYMKLLKGSLVAFFGETYGHDIADYVEQTFVDYYATYKRNGYPYYDEVKTFGNVDIVMPLISKSTARFDIFFTVH